MTAATETLTTELSVDCKDGVLQIEEMEARLGTVAQAAAAASKVNKEFSRSTGEAGAETEKTSAKLRVYENQTRALEGRIASFTARHDPLSKARRDLANAEDLYAKAARRGLEIGENQLRAMDNLRARVERLASANDDGVRSVQALAKAQAEAAQAADRAALNLHAAAVREKTDLAEMSAAIHELAAARAKLAAPVQITIAQTTGLDRAANTATTASRGDDIAAWGRELDRLQAQFDPVLAAQQRYENAVAELRDAHAKGAVDAAAYGRALAEIEANFNPATVAARANGAALEGLRLQFDEGYGAQARFAAEQQKVIDLFLAGAINSRQLEGYLAKVTQAYDPAARASREAAEALEREAAARQKVIAAAKAQAAAEDAQGRFNQALGVRPVAAGSASASAAVFMEAEQNAAALETLRRRYDATYAAEARHKEEVAHVMAVTKAANVSDAERAALLAKVEEAHAGAARSTAAHGQALRLLVPQLNDVFVTAAMGMNPLMIAIQQGPQIIDAFVLGGKEAGAEMLRLAATAAPIALLVGTIAALAAAQESYAGALRETARVNALTGGSSGFSDAGLERNAEAAAKAAHISVASARDVQNAYVATGQIGGRVLGELTAMTRDYAAATNQDMGAASEELAGMFSDPGRAAEDAAKRWKIFDDAQVRVIKNLQAQGRLEEAQMRLLDGLNGRVQGAAEKVSIYAKAWHDVETAVSDAWTALGKGLEGDDPGIAALKQRYEALLAAKGKPSLEFGFFGPRQSDIDGAGKEYGAAFGKSEADSWFAAKAKGDADFKDLQSRAMAFVRGMTPAIALAEDFANAQDLVNRAVAAGAISSDQAAQALRAYGLQVQQTIDPSKTLVDAINQETQALNLQAGAARNAWTALQQLQRQQPGREIGFDQAAGVQQGVAERSDAQSSDRARQVNDLAAAERRLNQARIAGNPREVARATVELGIAQKQAAGETVNAAEKAALHAQAQRGATAEIESQVHQLGLQVDAAERSAAAAGKGEAAQRRAAIETQVAAASLKGLGLETRMALEMQEAYVAAGIHNEFAGQIDQEVAANERLVAAMGLGVAAYREAEIHNKAVAQALKETPPEYDAAGAATGRFSEAISVNIALLKKQQGAADSVDLGKYVEKLKDARKDLDFRGSTAGMSDEAKAVAKAQYDTAEALRRQYGEYEKLDPAQQRQWDTAVKLAEENARIEEGVKRQEDAWNQLGQIGERAFDRIGDAVTQLFLEGKNKAISWGSLMKSVAASVAADIAKLGVNDLRRMVGLGGSGGGLSDLFGGAAQSNGQAAVQGQSGGLSVSGLGNLFGGSGSSIWGDSGSLSGYLFGNAGDPLMTGLSGQGLIGSGGMVGGVPVGQIGYGLGGAFSAFNAFQSFSQGNVVGGVANTISAGLGALGAFAPATFAALGPAAPIAMVALPLVASLFGGSKRPSGKGQSVEVDLDDNRVINTSGQKGKKYSQENADTARRLAESVYPIADAFEDFVGGGFNIKGGVVVNVDSNDGYNVKYNGQEGVRFSADEAGAKGIVTYIAQQLAQVSKAGLPDAYAAAMDRIDWTSIESGVADLNFLAGVRDGATALAEMDKSLAGMQKSAAAALSNALAPLTAQLEQASRLGVAGEWTDLIRGQFADMIDNVANAPQWTATQTAIAQLAGQFDALRQASDDLGLGFGDRIDAAQQAAMGRLRGDYSQALDQQVWSARGQDWRNELAATAKAAAAASTDIQALWGGDAAEMARQWGKAAEISLAAVQRLVDENEIAGQTFADLSAAWREQLTAAGLAAAGVDDLTAGLKSFAAEAETTKAEAVQRNGETLESRRLAALAAVAPQYSVAAEAYEREARYRQELVDAQDEASRAVLRHIQALEREAAAQTQAAAKAAAAADLTARIKLLLGDDGAASLIRFDAAAAAAQREAAAQGFDVNALAEVQAAERAQLAFQNAQSAYLTAIDREIRARQESSEALAKSALRVAEVAKSFVVANDNLRLAENSPLSPAERLAEVRRQFAAAEQQFRAAASQNEKESAAASLQELGQKRLDIAYQYYATTDYSDYDAVTKLFDELSIANDNTASTAAETVRQNDAIIDQLTEQRRAAERLGERQLGSLDALNANLVAAKTTLDAQLAALSGGGVKVVDPPRYNDSADEKAMRAALQSSGYLYEGRFRDGDFARWAEQKTSAATPSQQFAAADWDPSGGLIARAAALMTNFTGAFSGDGFLAHLKSGLATEAQLEGVRALLRKNDIWIPGFADGGLVTGGTPGVDSVHALLMPGERVLSVPHAAMLERIYAMAARPPANDPMPPGVLALRPSPAPAAQPSPPELTELVKLLRELIALIGATHAKALAQSGAIGGATLEKLEELIRETEEQTYQSRKAG